MRKVSLWLTSHLGLCKARIDGQHAELVLLQNICPDGSLCNSACISLNLAIDSMTDCYMQQPTTAWQSFHFELDL